MSIIVLLDAGPLGLVTNSGSSSPERRECNSWLESLAIQRVEAKVPEIADYEVRRELLRANKLQSVQRLNEFEAHIGYVPLTTETMQKAAELWAQIRKQGKPTADNKALDGDVILAAQAAVLEAQGYTVIIATTNVAHISRLATAKLWRDIP
jgi:predicted nucleic acid-binding protein